jgi:transposase
MSEQHGKTYRPWDPERYRHEAQSPAAKLPEGDLVFFLLDTVPQLDLRRFYAPYETETRGAPPFDPAMMVCLLLYAYCVGVFSSRKIALAGERNLAFMAIVGQERPDFRTISDFRKQHLAACKEVFVHVVRLAGEAGLVKLGNVSTDGTKIQGNASRHKAMSYGYMHKEVERVREEIEALVTAAYQQDEAEDAVLGSRRGDELPAELARREQRLATIAAAMQRLEAQAQAEAEAERQQRAAAEAERQRTGMPRPKDRFDAKDLVLAAEAFLTHNDQVSASDEAERFLDEDQPYLENIGEIQDVVTVLQYLATQIQPRIMQAYANDPARRFILSGGGTFFLSLAAACGYIRWRNNMKMLDGALDKLMALLNRPVDDPLNLDAYQRTLTRITSSRGKTIRRLVHDTFLRFFSGATSELEWEDTAGQIMGE